MHETLHMQRDPFGTLTRFYEPLEKIAFQNALEQARHAFLDHLIDKTQILLLGDGDGRFLQHLCQLNNKAEILSIDASNKMVQTAMDRIQKNNPVALKRISWQVADVTNISLPSRKFDALTTIFFLDCFSQSTLEKLIPTLTTSLKPGALWYQCDFVRNPQSSIPFIPLRNAAWLRLLYTFFKITCELETTQLATPEKIMQNNNLQRCHTKRFCGQLLETSVWKFHPQ